MDEEFYGALREREKAGHVSNTELAQLVEEHLDKVEQFERRARREVARMRRHRQRVSAQATWTSVLFISLQNYLNQHWKFCLDIQFVWHVQLITNWLHLMYFIFITLLINFIPNFIQQYI